MAAHLSAYLDRMGAVPFQWGHSDCVKFVCGWLVENGHADPSDDFGVYDEAGGRSILGTFNGLADLASYGLSGLTETSDPQRGDVGVVYPLGVPEPIMAIFSGKRWLFKANRGILACAGTCLKAWRV